MANDLNQCNFIGRLGADPEVRYAPSGMAVASFRIAVGWKSKDKEGAEWVSISAFDKLAEICGEYLKKGAQVFVSGRFKTEEYTDKEGIKRYAVKIVADRMQMLGAKQDGAAPTPAPQTQQRHGDRPGARPAAKAAPTGTGFDDMDDDIPF